jgi:integrase
MALPGPNALTVAALWAIYEPVSRRDNDSWQTERGRAQHLVRHLGSKVASTLSLDDVENYRTGRLEEKTVRGEPPAPATLDREVELLKRMLNHAVARRRLYANPLAQVKLLAKANVRRSNVREDDFARLLEAAPSYLRPILTMAYDTGLRITSILRLRWDQVDLQEGCVVFAAGELKNDEPLKVYLTRRLASTLDGLERKGPCVFPNPDTGEHYRDIRKAFHAAAEAIGRPELWIHDLRRSFATRARRRGVPQAVVQRMGGWKTDSAFRRYNIVEDRDVQDAAKLLDE